MTDRRTADFRFRPLVAGDLPAAADLSKRVGWPHRLEDWRFLHGLARSIAVDADGDLAGTGMVWPLGPGHVAVGMVIIDPDRQGAGIGRRVMDDLLAHAGARAVLLNATAAGIALYERLGFTRLGRVQQHQGIATVAPADARVRPARPGDAERIAALDRAATGLDRAPILRALATEAEAAVLERDGMVSGFAFCRRFGRGQMIGPVVAATREDAQALIADWARRHAGTFVRVDVPEESGLPEWLPGLGLAPVAPVVSMVRGAAPVATGPARVFGLIAQATG